MNDNDRVFFEKVVREYYACAKSLRRTASHFGVSRSKVKRILITMGEMKSEIAEKALEWLKQGYSQQEIADMLHVSETTLSTHLPYGDTVYNREQKTSNAIRSKEYRTRQTLAAMHQVAHMKQKDKVREMKEFKDGRILKLRLELDLASGDRLVLRKFGRVEEGIIREILIPEEYPLHALHYIIQKLFGWQNCHLHHFLLDTEDMDSVVKDSFQRYCDLCGIYFRFTYGEEDFADIYWDDDYEPGKSFKSWLKKRYTAPEKYCGLLEHYLFSQIEVDAFRFDYPVVEICPSFEEWYEGRGKHRRVSQEKASYKDMTACFEGKWGQLLERLTVGEVLTIGNRDFGSIDSIIKERKASFDHTLDEYVLLNEQSGGFTEEMDSLIDRMDGTVFPVTDHLVYEYDYGDGWKVSIRLVDEYSREQVEGGLDSSAELKRMLMQVFKKRAPVCTFVDGLPVLDDVGGMSGYCDFLLGIHDIDNNGPYDDPEKSRAWARSLGWSGRISRVL